MINKLNEISVGNGQIAIMWIGQAGFIIKTSENTIITIDPYLSDCVEREFGFKRLMPSIIEPELLITDFLIITHEHLDHFDIDSMPALYLNTRNKVICSPTVAEKCNSMNLDDNKLVPLARGNEVSFGNVHIKAVYADHGELAPDSIGILLEVNDIKMYFSSDTGYRPAKIFKSLNCTPDLAILPINGMYGNLNSIEAVKLAKHIGAKAIIPCHFWIFREHNGPKGDPLSFEKAMKKYFVEGLSIFLTPGEIYIFEKGGL